MTRCDFSIFHELRPTNRPAEPARAKFLRKQNVIGKNSTWSALPSKNIVEGNDRAFGQKRSKQFEIALRGFVTMIAIDPKNTNRFAPLFRQILREPFEYLHRVFLTAAPKIILKFGITGSFRQIAPAWICKRIACPDLAITGRASGFAENNRRRAFERADLKDAAARRGISAEQRQKIYLTLLDCALHAGERFANLSNQFMKTIGR